MRKVMHPLFFVISLLLASGITMISKGEDTQQEGMKTGKPKITVSAETTYFIEPLLKDGSLDCVALLNKISREGIDVDDNAAVMIWRALGPETIPVTNQDDFYKLLGIAELRQNGDYYVTFAKYVDKYDKQEKGSRGESAADNSNETFYKQFETAQKRPWDAKEFPLLADLLNKNEKPLELLSEAVLRPKFYSPLVKASDDFSSCLDTDFKFILRDAAEQLLVRSMLRLNEKQYDTAWQDLLTCYRLGLLVSQGPLLIDILYGTAFQGMAAKGIWTFSNRVEHDAIQLQKYQMDLLKLPLPPNTDKIWQLGERVFQVGYIYDLSKKDKNSLKYLGISKDDSTREVLKKLASDPKMDWDEVLRLLNAESAKYVALIGKDKYSAIRDKMQKLDADIAEECRKALEPASLEKVLSPNATPKDKAKLFVAILANSGMANSAWMITPPYRGQTFASLSQLALAISAYRAENHSYPVALADLAPKYISEIPKDPFSSSDFKYKLQDNGFLLYSVGLNARDDGGKNYLEENNYNPDEYDKVSEEEKSADDIAIRVPPKKD